MTPTEADPIGLIRESFRIDGIGAAECRSIFLDWALKLPAGTDQTTAIAFLLELYGRPHPDHPMTAILTEGLGAATRTGRRGGRGRRHGG